MTDTIRIGVIGCGNIAGRYMETLKGVPGLEVAGVVDLDTDRARDFAREHGVPFTASREELLADPAIDIIANLTIHYAHYEVTKAALEAGKHVFSEKPLTLDPGEARELVDLAKARNLRLSCAPVTFLGEAQQTLANRVRGGDLGTVRVVYAEVNHGRIETWHPNPAPFYEVGPVLDVGVYPVALVTSILGPVRSVSAWGKIIYPERRTAAGEPFKVKAPDFTTAMLEFECGALMRLTANFYVLKMTPNPTSVEFHGDTGSALVESWFAFNSTVKAAAFSEPLEAVPLDYPQAYEGVEWSRGLQDLADAIRNNRPHRASAEHAAHVVEILKAINTSVQNRGAPMAVSSSFPLPEPWQPLG